MNPEHEQHLINNDDVNGNNENQSNNATTNAVNGNNGNQSNNATTNANNNQDREMVTIRINMPTPLDYMTARLELRPFRNLTTLKMLKDIHQEDKTCLRQLHAIEEAELRKRKKV